MTAEMVLACVLSMIEGRAPAEGCKTPFVQEVGAAVEASSKRYDVPAGIIAAVIYHESRFNRAAIGTRGEVGLMQIMRGGAVPARHVSKTDRQLMNVRLNIMIGTAYLARFRRRCESTHWIAPFNGGRCRQSAYTMRVLADLARGQALSEEL